MEKQIKKQVNVRYITELGLFIGIILLMKLTGLSSIPIGPLVMTFTMIPIAIGAMLLGPLAGTILGAFYGLLSLYDAITGKSLMTGIFFQISPFMTVLLCVGTRTLVGFLTGVLFRVFQKLDRRNIWCYFAGGLAAPLLNTFFFMSFIVLVFYQVPFIQGRVFRLTDGAVGFQTVLSPFENLKTLTQAAIAYPEAVRVHNATLGLKGPLSFVVLTVGVQGLIEWATGLVIGGSVAKGVAVAIKREKPIPFFKPVKTAAETAAESGEAAPDAETTDEQKEE
ncbi:MAG: ECF transporter S component [Clostridia bacterium]|nr:ECF transporter S component [Clostridia bacterium]